MLYLLLYFLSVFGPNSNISMLFLHVNRLYICLLINRTHMLSKKKKKAEHIDKEKRIVILQQRIS